MFSRNVLAGPESAAHLLMFFNIGWEPVRPMVADDSRQGAVVVAEARGLHDRSPVDQRGVDRVSRLDQRRMRTDRKPVFD